MQWWTILPVVAFLPFSGCAHLDYLPYPEKEPAVGQPVGGIVYYDDSPYLIVWPDGKGNILWQLQFLPDQTKKRIASPHNFIASLNANLLFTNGTISQSTVTVDDTAVLQSLEAAAGSVASGLLTASSTKPSHPDIQNPQPPSNTAQVWIFKITLSTDEDGNTSAEFANASQTIVVPLKMELAVPPTEENRQDAEKRANVSTEPPPGPQSGEQSR